jgi:hypothetical protein
MLLLPRQKSTPGLANVLYITIFAWNRVNNACFFLHIVYVDVLDRLSQTFKMQLLSSKIIELWHVSVGRI